MKGKKITGARKASLGKLDVLKDALEEKSKAAGSIMRAFRKLMHQEPEEPPGKPSGRKK